jgi:stress response protein SCP2
MSIVLVKGQKADLTRLDPKLRCVNIELSWHTAIDQEIDASAFLAGSNGKVLKDSDFVFYGQTFSGCRSVIKKNSKSFQIFLK